MTVKFIKGFGGLKPNTNPRLLQDSEAQTANNTLLNNGSVRPYKAGTQVKALTIAAQTIFRYGDVASDTQYWFEFPFDADVIRSAVNADQYKRVYWTGDTYPKYSTEALALGAGTLPSASYKLGVPRPTARPSVAGTAAPVYNKVSRQYVMTFASSTKESAPSPPLTVQAVDTFAVKITGLPVPVAGAGYTEKRIYRRTVGTVPYKFVATVALDVTEYEDTVPDASLGAILSTGAADALPVPSNVRANADSVKYTAAATSRQYAIAYGGFIYNVPTGESLWVDEDALSSAATISVDETQSVTVSGTVDTTTYPNAQFIRVYRRDGNNGTFVRIGSLNITGSSYSYTDTAKTATGSGHSPTATTGTPAAPTLTASATTGITDATIKQYLYCATFVGSDGTESKRSAETSVVKAVNGVTPVVITWDKAPASVAKIRLYRRTTIFINGIDQGNDDTFLRLVELPAAGVSWTDTATIESLYSNPGLPNASKGVTYVPGSTPFASATIPPAVIPETRVYCYTYVTAYDEEGPPSEASVEVSLDPAKPVTISGMATSPGGLFNINRKRIYRSAVGRNSTTFQFVAEVSLATTSYTDSKTGTELGEVLPSEKWVAPPENLKGLCLGANGIAAGFVDNNVYFSEAFRPHAWPEEYILTTEHKVVAIAPFGQNFAVLTTSFPYLVTGSDPASMSMTKLDMPEACVSKKSAIAARGGVIYASPDGLILISSTGIVNLTQGLLSRDQWQAYTPSSMIFREYNNKIYVSHSAGSLIFDFTGESASFVTTNLIFTAGFYDALTDNLYYVNGGNILKWNTGSNLTYTWRSKLFTIPDPINFSFGQVEASAYPITAKFYAEGTLRHTQTVTSREPFRLPSGFKSKDWEFEIEGTAEVFHVAMATNINELRAT